jgi:hypothetical protein
MKRTHGFEMLVATLTALAVGCGDDDDGPAPEQHEHDSGPAAGPEPRDPDSAQLVAIDRFSEDAATLMVRTDENGLPGADEPIAFDQAPFITQGLGPNGEVVRYYNFDVQPVTPAPIYALFREGEDVPVAGQLNVIDVVPGDEGYNDFWQVHRVTVSEDYVANTITSLSEIEQMDLAMEPTEMIVNCPVVPDGSTASERLEGASSELHSGWYRGRVVRYFTFEEKALSGAAVPLSPIYVAFNVNPDEPGGGPGSGFVTEEGSEQTHNVLATLPEDAGYSPLWHVQVYDNAAFDDVADLDSVQQAPLLGEDAATVNCPVVSIEPTP